MNALNTFVEIIVALLKLIVSCGIFDNFNQYDRNNRNNDNFND